MKLKNKILFCFLFSTKIIFQAFAEDTPVRAMVLTEPLGFLNNAINVKYEKIITPKNSWKIGGVVWNYNTTSWKWNAYGGEFLYKTFTKPENSPNGIWWAIGGIAISMKVEHTYTTYELDNDLNIIEVQKTSYGNFTLIGPAAYLGYSWLLGANKGFIVSVFGGYSYLTGSSELDGEKLPYGGASFGFGLEVGITLK